MRHVLAVVAVALAVSLVWAPTASAQTKWVRGTVVSVSGDTFVVKTADKDLTFKVDKSTVLTARGAGTAQAKAEAAGQTGVKFAEFVKPGLGVEVHFRDVGGTLIATDVHSGLSPAEGRVSGESTSGSARGAVSAISGSSVTVMSAGHDWTFAVDAKTVVVGQGLGTINKQLKDQGKAPTVGNLLGMDDQVVVYFDDAAGIKRAREIRVIAKAAK
jgi:hypothetical protein